VAIPLDPKTEHYFHLTLPQVNGGKARRKETTRKTKTGGWKILKWILERLDEVVWTVFIDLS
jgi:hypothetical protein